MRVLPYFALLASVLGCTDATDRTNGFSRAGNVMGTVAELKALPRSPGVGTRAAAEAALDEAFGVLERVEERTTSYHETSDVSRLQRSETPFVVSDDTDATLRLALEVAAATDGAFDPTMGALMRAWGFPEAPAVPDSARVRAARSRVSADRLRPEGDGAWIVEPATELDLGGIAKGWAVDRAADLLEKRVGPCLVNVGGDLAVRGSKPGGEPWRIGVQDPRDPSRLFVTLRLSGKRAVATSGDYQRYVEVDGVRYHHLLDPRTGWPARGVNSVTVVGPSCAVADAWATAVFVMGPVAGLAALEEQPELEGVVVTVDESGALVQHETPGFAAFRQP